MENLIRELKQAIENFNLYLKNEYTTINNKIQGISNDISDYSVFRLSAVSAKDLKVNLTFPRATYIMVSIKNAPNSAFVELSINQQTKEKLRFYDGSFHKGIIRDIYLSYDFSNLEQMPDVEIYVGYNSSFNPITPVRLADVTSENPLPVILSNDKSDLSNKFLNMLTKQMLLILQEKAKFNNEKTLQIIATPNNAVITVTYDGKTFTSEGYFVANIAENTSVSYSVSLSGYLTQSGTLTMSDNQTVNITLKEPKTFKIIVTEPTTNVAIDITVNGTTTTYNSNTTGDLTFDKGTQIHYKIYDTGIYDNSVIGADGYETVEGDKVLNESMVIYQPLQPTYTVAVDVNAPNLPYGSVTITAVFENDNVIPAVNTVIPNANVLIVDTETNQPVNNYVTDQNGKAVVNELAGQYAVYIAGEGGLSGEGVIDIEPNTDTEETILLS